jgi:membrane protein implicated in regulation of membrane protease activity
MATATPASTAASTAAQLVVALLVPVLAGAACASGLFLLVFAVLLSMLSVRLLEARGARGDDINIFFLN